MFPVFEMEVNGMKFLAVQLNPYGLDTAAIFGERNATG